MFGCFYKKEDFVNKDEVKGADKIAVMIKRWKDKGTVVEYVPNTQTPKLSEYVIRAIG